MIWEASWRKWEVGLGRSKGCWCWRKQCKQRHRGKKKGRPPRAVNLWLESKKEWENQNKRSNLWYSSVSGWGFDVYFIDTGESLKSVWAGNVIQLDLSIWIETSKRVEWSLMGARRLGDCRSNPGGKLRRLHQCGEERDLESSGIQRIWPLI